MLHIETTYSSNNHFGNDFPDYSATCDHQMLANLLLQQWKRITPSELEDTRYNKHRIALLIERKYGLDPTLVENYLSNMERSLPLAA